MALIDNGPTPPPPDVPISDRLRDSRTDAEATRTRLLAAINERQAVNRVMIKADDGSLLLNTPTQTASDYADLIYNADKRRGVVEVRSSLPDPFTQVAIDVVVCHGWLADPRRGRKDRAER